MVANATDSGSDETVEEGFLTRLRTHPDDEDNRLVYADWLEEHARVDQSEFLRLQTSLKKMGTEDPSFKASGVRLRELALRLDQHWRTIVARAPIEKCEARFDFACPKQWDALTPTKQGDHVRFCKSCEKDVHYTKSVAEAWTHASQGHCVVVDLVQLRRPGDLDGPLAMPPPPIMMAGAPALPPDWQQQQQQQQVVPPPEPPPPGLLSRVKKALFDR